MPDTKTRTCALAQVSKCDGKLNREHYVSNAVLKLIFTDEKGFVGGLPWSGVDLKPISAQALTSKILCEGHNKGLSRLDNLAKLYFKAIQSAELDLATGTDQSQKFVFSGDDFERWLLKCAFGLWSSGNFANGGKKIEGQPPELWGQILLGAKFPEGWGLYVRPIEGEFALSEREFEAVPLTAPDGRVLAVNFRLARMPFTLVMGTPDHPEAWGIYRPSGVSLGNDRAQRRLEFSWKGSHSPNGLFYKRLRDVEPPPDV